MDKSSVKTITSSKTREETNDFERTSSSASRRFCSRLCTRCHLNIRQDEVILRAKHLIFHLDCFTCVTCHQHLHPGDEFGLKDESIFCRQHFFDQQQQQQSYDPSAFLDDSGYYTSPLPNLTTSSTTTSQPPTTTPSVKRTRKRKDRSQTQTHDDLISSSSEHFLALSPSSSSNLGKNLIARRSWEIIASH